MRLSQSADLFAFVIGMHYCRTSAQSISLSWMVLSRDNDIDHEAHMSELEMDMFSEGQKMPTRTRLVVVGVCS